MCVCVAFPSGESEGKLNEIFSVKNNVKFRMRQAVGGCLEHGELVKKKQNKTKQNKTNKQKQVRADLGQGKGYGRAWGLKDTFLHLH